MRTVTAAKFCLSAVLSAALAACATCEPKPNLGVYKNTLVQWHVSGGYDRCFTREADKARNWLSHVIRTSGGKSKIAVVFDIDETALSNWPYLLDKGFDVRWDTFEAWSQSADALPLVPVRELYRDAVAAGLSVFFVTGRHESLRTATERELRKAGYAKWDGLYLLPPSYDDRSVIPFKSGVRQALEAQGYRVVLNIGDQWSDLEGGHAEKAFKLPNPYYFIP